MNYFKSLSLAMCAFASSSNALELPVINEVFFTTDQTRENIDSPASWHGPAGEHLLFATSKEGHSVNVFNATNGIMLQRIGGHGIELGQFDRPNGIWVVDNLMLVVERDNQRVQVLSIPDMKPLTSFGEDVLGKPYGLYVRKRNHMEYDVYVTDNYETPEGEVPADAELGRRVQRFLLEVEGDSAEGEWVAAFGDTSGEGRLYVVESIHGDPAHQRLLVADELEDSNKGRVVKIYDLNGHYTGQNIGQGIFEAQVEGIALYETSDTSGYWIVTDQSKTSNRFHLFDRVSLDYLGGFEGAYTLNTDGVWATTKVGDRYPMGLFYACENDRAVSAFDFADIFEALGLDAPHQSLVE
ncbi:phytase [Coraliomargarita sp. SDUM461004]|uniref:Phytase n=1 Tax=Thalassobacterium sedimentorum TaxID=3041258 RepID=A0ABU1AHA4_9BACT|nr:phytase [Coraliomargarita sp. SDUM461004]MDQ8193984.1 phytase [Coraliomargarita sp. SDUM461004]